MDGSLRSSSGGIQARVTERGLPIALKISQVELSKPPSELARDILLVCQLLSKRSQVARRQELTERGFSPAVIRALKLSSEEELARAEANLRANDQDGLPDTWMGSK